MSRHDEIHDLVELYALGALEPDEYAQVEAHLGEGCESCQARVLENEGVAAELAKLLKTHPVDVNRRSEILTRVRQDAEASSGAVRPRSRYVPLALAASLVLAIGMGVALLGQQRTIETLRAARDLVGDELSRTRTELAQTQTALEAITAPETRPVALSGKGNAANARATAFLDARQGRLLLYVHGLPVPAPGRTYQLWVIVEGKPISLGVFDVQEGGQARLTAQQLPELRGPVTVAVTEEPAGGVPQPTGPMVLAGS